MIRMEWTFQGCGDTELYVREWKPDKERPKGVLCLIHGMGEHGDRYSAYAAKLVAAQYVVIALDQQGHGRSSGPRGHLPSVDDAAAHAAMLVEQAAQRHPELPIFLYGHSMGGNIAMNCALRLQPAVKALVLSSPWLRLAFTPPRAQLWLGKRLAAFWPGLPQSTGLGSGKLYRRGYEEAAHIEGDPLCHSRITVKTFLSLHDSGEWAIANCGQLHVPLLLIHGAADKITSHHASEQVAQRLGEACTFVSWPDGYHELHNDLEAQRFIEVVTNWLDMHTDENKDHAI
ncbi:alpha/beta hydrolase [Paenibacillus sp. Leaf72]|uniref:alpha/beta hydrolase n=1 Tax=Paenibacillus sp. Leaf72 TaxID=1736234 RepID=UPI0006F34198|nr:alpha/beta hydrolase [Paenibacillus sp. Leaf72]KQN97070.1 hypothetical protein ASF12_23680 [Paenibacillus sp. Leaf72]